jgi:hypothetical protein
MDRTGRPEQAHAPALRRIIKMIDMAIENGSLDASDRDEVIQMFISGPTTVVDNKAGGGMMNMDEMIRPIGYTFGGSVDELGTGLKKLKLQKLAGGLGLSENALDELDILDSMSVIEIDALFDKMIGGE